MNETEIEKRYYLRAKDKIDVFYDLLEENNTHILFLVDKRKIMDKQSAAIDYLLNLLLHSQDIWFNEKVYSGETLLKVATILYQYAKKFLSYANNEIIQLTKSTSCIVDNEFSIYIVINNKSNPKVELGYSIDVRFEKIKILKH